MKAKLNLKNIKGYLQAHYRQVLDDMGFLDKHIYEQAEWRLSRVKEKSPNCYNSDKCVHCGCQVSSKVFEDRACEGGCYPEMMSESEWKWFDIIEWEYQEDNKGLVTSGPIIIRDLSKEETLADLMQNNPTLTKEELLYWCPEFKGK